MGLLSGRDRRGEAEEQSVSTAATPLPGRYEESRPGGHPASHGGGLNNISRSTALSGFMAALPAPKRRCRADAHPRVGGRPAGCRPAVRWVRV